MKKKFMTRTQLAKHVGVTVATLKDHLVHRDILEANGKSPSVRAHLEGLVQWRLLASDETQRYFMLDVAACEAALPELMATKKTRPPLVASKNSAINILREAGRELSEAIDPSCSGEVEEYGTDEMVWLIAGCTKDCLTAHNAEEKRNLAKQIGDILGRIQKDVESGLIMETHPDVTPALVKIRAVMQWFDGGKPNAAASPNGPRPAPPVFHALNANRTLTVERYGGRVTGIHMPVSADEIRLIRAGHTLRREGNATGPILDALARVCGMIHQEWTGGEAVNYARISVDGGSMLFSDWDISAENGRKQLVAKMGLEINGSTVTISSTGAEGGDELLAIGANAADRHFGPERVLIR